MQVCAHYTHTHTHIHTLAAAGHYLPFWNKWSSSELLKECKVLLVDGGGWGSTWVAVALLVSVAGILLPLVGWDGSGCGGCVDRLGCCCVGGRAGAWGEVPVRWWWCCCCWCC